MLFLDLVFKMFYQIVSLLFFIDGQMKVGDLVEGFIEVLRDGGVIRRKEFELQFRGEMFNLYEIRV